MYIKVTYRIFKEELMNKQLLHLYSESAIRVIYEYLTEVERKKEQEYELDIESICSTMTEYKNIDALIRAYPILENINITEFSMNKIFAALLRTTIGSFVVVR